MVNIQFDVIGKRIQLRRKEKNLKQGDLAELLEISNNHISSIENGRERPSLETFVKICYILEVSPDYLLLGTIHTDDTPRRIVEKIRLCSQADILLVDNFIELLVERNQKNINKDFHPPIN